MFYKFFLYFTHTSSWVHHPFYITKQFFRMQKQFQFFLVKKKSLYAISMPKLDPKYFFNNTPIATYLQDLDCCRVGPTVSPYYFCVKFI